MPLPTDDLHALTDAALSTAQAAGCAHAELRVERIRSQQVRLRDAVPEGSSDDTEFGMGVRVVLDGAVGFAATVDVTPAEAANLVRQAIEAARVTAQAGGGRVELAPEPSHGEVVWTSPFEIDPGDVPLADKVALLENWSRGLLDAAGVSHVTASVLSVGEETYLADLGGTRATQRRVRLHPQLDALALSDSGFETMRTLGVPGRGHERCGDGGGLGLGRRVGGHA
jgi:TldD protein